MHDKNGQSKLPTASDRETMVREFLEAMIKEHPNTFLHLQNHEFIDFRCFNGNQPDADGKSRAFIDIVVTCTNKIMLCIEVDQYQHHEGNYSVSCETARMCKIDESLRIGGFDGRLVFIRYNPDAFQVDGQIKRVAKKERLEALKHKMLAVMNSETPNGASMEVHYLLYDEEHC